MNGKNKRTESDMVEELSALVYETDEFPSLEKARAILTEEGIDTASLKSWVSEKLKGAQARQRLAAARAKRLAWEDRIEALRRGVVGPVASLRDKVLEKIRILGEADPDAAQVYCRKFEEIPDADLEDLDTELSLLDQLADEDDESNKDES